MERSTLRQRLIEEIGVPVSQKTVTANNIHTHYLSAGEGEPILLLHGATAGGALSWYPMIKPLASRFRVVVPDCPGYGESEMAARRHDIPLFVHWLDNLLDQLNIDDAAIIGTSQGGSIALRYALHAPQRVKQLALIASSGLSSRLGMGSIVFGLWCLLLGICPARPLEVAFENSMLFQGKKRNQALYLYRQYTNAIAGRPEFQSVNWLQRIIRINRPLGPDELRRIVQPTLLLWSARDRLFPLRIAQAAVSVLPQAQLHIVPQTGHAAYLENPSGFSTAILPFLASNL